MKKFNDSKIFEYLLLVFFNFGAGFLGAYSIIKFSGIFANAQTANLINVFIHVADGKPDFSRLLGFLAFVLGISATVLTKHFLGKEKQKKIIPFIIGIILVVQPFIRCSNNMLMLVPLVFALALQYNTFTSWYGVKASTPFITNNIRQLVESVWMCFLDKKDDTVTKVIVFFTAIVSFLAGALILSLFKVVSDILIVILGVLYILMSVVIWFLI